MPSKSPDAFRTISEVADWLNTPAHVLRFWESKFSQVKPVKRAGGRRYYRPADMTLLGGIKKLLHDDGMTIKGVQKILREQGIKHVSAMSPPLEEDLEAMIEATPQATPAPMAPETGQVLDFTSRSGPGDAPPDTPAPSEPESAVPLSAPNETLREATPEITDLFAPEGTGSDNAFASPEEATPAPSAPDSPAETADTEGLPDFLQKPMSERLAETPGGPSATPLPEEALDNPPPADPAETTKAAEDAPQAPSEPEPDPLSHALPDPAPEATAPVPSQASPEDDAALLAAVLRDSEAEEEDDDDDAPRVRDIDVPPDPSDHEVAAAPGLLTLLTAPKTRDLGLSAEQIETLIVRVRDHARAMSHAARN
ncbi:MerR family transcriptional regulator [Marinovum algicola]|uniref:MerR family transcriptional regulator n=1 Tax=Marinovum algicola TaxID=42444 RepID=UPI0024B9CC4E|nr:MerR family transcriptional regulator [Marinovum algicola]